jgi:hypothetical protein
MDELEAVRSFRRNDATPNHVARAAARDRLIAHIADDDRTDKSFDPVLPRLAGIRNRLIVDDDRTDKSFDPVLSRLAGPLGGTAALLTAVVAAAGLFLARQGSVPFTDGSPGQTPAATTQKPTAAHSDRSPTRSPSDGSSSPPSGNTSSSPSGRPEGLSSGSNDTSLPPPPSAAGPELAATPSVSPSPMRVMATARAIRDSYNGTCPPPVDRSPSFEGVISVSHGPVTVEYQWLSSNGGSANSNLKTVTFRGSGPQQRRVHFTQRVWPDDRGGRITAWIALYIRVPIGTESNHVSYAVVCTPR